MAFVLEEPRIGKEKTAKANGIQRRKKETYLQTKGPSRLGRKDIFCREERKKTPKTFIAVRTASTMGRRVSARFRGRENGPPEETEKSFEASWRGGENLVGWKIRAKGCDIIPELPYEGDPCKGQNLNQIEATSEGEKPFRKTDIEIVALSSLPCEPKTVFSMSQGKNRPVSDEKIDLQLPKGSWGVPSYNVHTEEGEQKRGLREKESPKKDVQNLHGQGGGRDSRQKTKLGNVGREGSREEPNGDLGGKSAGEGAITENRSAWEPVHI